MSYWQTDQPAAGLSGREISRLTNC